MPATRVPTKIKELSGNPGKRKLNKSEPKPSGIPSAPPIMSPMAKKVWGRLIASMPPGVFTGADTDVLAAYCEAVANHRQATSAIMEAPSMMITGSTGQSVLNPIFKHQSDQARLIVTLGARLGLDPIARQAINAPDDGGKDEFDGLIN